MTTKRLRLVERAGQSVAVKRGPRTWLERLSAEDRAELEGFKAKWRSGQIEGSARAAAGWLVKQCQAAGVKTCGEEHMRQWLSRD